MNIALLAEFYQQSHIKVPHKPISGHDAAIEDTVFVPEKFAEFIIRECASIVYRTCEDGDAGAQAILYEFDIDDAKSQK